jgi:hypothetical protein
MTGVKGLPPTLAKAPAVGEWLSAGGAGILRWESFRERMTPLPQDDNVGGMAALSVVIRFPLVRLHS